MEEEKEEEETGEKIREAEETKNGEKVKEGMLGEERSRAENRNCCSRNFTKTLVFHLLFWKGRWKEPDEEEERGRIFLCSGHESQ